MRKYANVYRKKNGTYQLRFTIDGKRYAVYGKTVEECRQKEAEKREKLRSGLITDNSTFDQYAAKWLQFHAITIKESTAYMYEKSLKNVSPFIGSKKLCDITPQDIREMQVGLAEKLKPSTVNKAVGTAAVVFASAVNDGILSKSPCRSVKRLKTAKSAIHRALTKEETKAFLRAAKGDTYEYLYIFMLHTGCRLGEALALVDEDIKEGKLHITKTVSNDRKGRHGYTETTKTAAGNRVVPLNITAQEALKTQQDIRDAIAPGNPHVFISQGGILPTYSSVCWHIREVCEKAKIEPISSHAFRDTFATRCAEAKMQPKVLMELLGHSNISMTMLVYVHAMDDIKAQELAAVSF